jgi:hypothetical protein
MSEAHEKTRIRQLEDAAAHWEHKYANARQYNRNLEERIAKLEAALRKIAVGLLPKDGAAGYVLCASRLCAIAREAIRSPSRPDNLSSGSALSDKGKS